MIHINGIEVPEPLKTPPEKGTEYWTLGGGQWTWYGTTHDFTSLGKGIWLTEQETWKVNRAIRVALGLEEFTLSSISQAMAENQKHFGVEEQVQDSKELHTCPYREEIHNDYESLCDCDEEQQRQCAMDI